MSDQLRCKCGGEIKQIDVVEYPNTWRLHCKKCGKRWIYEEEKKTDA